MALALPVAPILLFPFILIFFVVVFPFWLVAIALLGALMWITRGIEALVRLGNKELGKPISGPVSSAFHWTLSWGGIAQRRDRPKPVGQSDSRTA